MKHIMRLLLGLVALMSVAFAQYPVDGVQTLSSGFTCASAATTNLNTVIDCARQANVGVQFSVTYNTAGTTNTATFTVVRSVDGLVYDTTGTPVVLTANGTTPVVTLTNLPSNGARYMKITTLVNSTGAAIASGSTKYATKISAP